MVPAALVEEIYFQFPAYLRIGRFRGDAKTHQVGLPPGSLLVVGLRLAVAFVTDRFEQATLVRRVQGGK